MKIARESDKASGILPGAFDVLGLEFGYRMHSSRRPHRPPLGIYNTSLDRIESALTQLLDCLKPYLDANTTIDPSKGLTWFTEILSAQLELLNSLMAHLDDCKLILQSQFASNGDYRKSPIVSQFWSRVRPYKDHLERIVNHIKHNQGRLRPFAFYARKLSYLGYYVEGVDHNGKLGPELSIHKRGKGAFSFQRDIRYHLVHIYWISERLALALDGILGLGGLRTQHKRDQTRILSIATRVQSLSKEFFPDEIMKPVPKVIVSEEPSAQRRILFVMYQDDGSALSIKRVIWKAKIALEWRGDDVSDAYRLPYPAILDKDSRFVLEGPKG